MAKRGIIVRDKTFFVVCSSVTAIFLTVFLCFSLITPATTYAEGAVASSTSVDVDFEVGSVCALRVLDSTGTTPISSIDLDVAPAESGTFVKDGFTVQVDTNNTSGYSLFFTAETTDLKNSTYDDSIPSIDSDVTEADFSVAGSLHQNKWGVSKSWSETIGGEEYTGGNPSLYFPVVNVENISSLSDLTIRDDVDKPAINSRTKIGVGMNINIAKMPGAYTDQIAFVAIPSMPQMYAELAFDRNGDNVVGDVPAMMSSGGVSSSVRFVIPETNLTKDGYEFAGWSKSKTELIGYGSGPNRLYVAGDSVYVDGSLDQNAVEPEVLYAVWQTENANSVVYNANASGASGTMEKQTLINDAMFGRSDNGGMLNLIEYKSNRLMLEAPNFVNPGYGFIGWNTKPDGSGIMFGPNETLIASDYSESVDQGGMNPTTLTQDMRYKLATEGLSFYAQWAPSVGDMQNWTGCSSLNVGDVIALTDTRTDTINLNPTYAVAKLADGKCWMIENLRYAGAGASIDTWDEWGRDSQSYTKKQYNYSNISLPDEYSAPISGLESYVDSSGYGLRSEDETGHRWYGYGAYYSWAAAMDTTTAYGEGEVNAGSGICPAGWRVPTADKNNSESDFIKLHSALIGDIPETAGFTITNKYKSFPNNIVMAGLWDGNAYQRGYSTKYWSSYSEATNVAQTLECSPMFSNRGCRVSLGGGKAYGMSVRCVSNS